MHLAGKAAIVTGASRGVGRATALALAQGGCSVLINYSQSRDEAERTAEEVRSLGVKSVCFQGDVAKDDTCRQMAERAARDLGRLDILINNAATTEFIPHAQLEKFNDEHWDRIFGVNVKGAFFCARAARDYMDQAGQGVIINVASIAGITGSGSSIAYCASKAALINLTLSLARVLAPKIRVNAVAPGFIASQWTRDGLGPNYEATKQTREKRAALGKVCLPEDVAAAILGLITGGDMITGQTLVCDGGDLVGPRA